MRITHQYCQDSLFGGSDTTDVDISASMDKFAEMCEKSIQEAYPSADVTVEDNGNCYTIVDGADLGERDEIKEAVVEIASQVWQTWDWVVTK